MAVDISLIKSRLSCVEYAQRIGLPIQKPGDRCTSPLRNGAKNKSSFTVHANFWFDFGSSQGGDLIDLAALTQFNGNRGEAIRELARLTGVTDDTDYSQWVNYTQNLCNQIQKWHESLRPEDLEYLHERRISDETINTLKIGYDPIMKRIIIPYFKNGYVYSWIARQTLPDQKPKYLKLSNNDFTEGHPWGLHTLKQPADHLIIAEGAFDAISFAQENYPVLGTMGGHFPRSQQKFIIDLCRQYPTVFLCYDNDTAGSGFTLEFSKLLFNHKIPFIIGNLPPKYKDVSEYYADNNSLADLITNATNGTIALCKHITDKNEFKTFVYQAARFVGRPELAELFAIARPNFPTEWFKELVKSATSAPPEDLIAKAVLKQHNLRYLAGEGFYEYQQGAWRSKTDEEIQSYIGDELGPYRTGSKLSSIAKLIKADTITTEPFNKTNVFNFINGTLELDTGTFREHRESDLSSIQVNYPYDSDATCPQWLNFIDQIANYAPERIALLQEIAGYVLFPTCELEKIFILSGSGGNGKSKYLSVLQELFGRGNVSNVTLVGLMSDFQRINIMNSLLNISTEIKTNLSGVEEYIKQIASGETISACFKGKDFINFNPRCKMFFACNDTVTASDTSDGLMRRMCFINFECRFVDTPIKDNEYAKDVNILDKLLRELPGIFNWAYSGYKELSQHKRFSDGVDKDNTMKDFQEATNPILVFIQEVNWTLTRERITNADLYLLYRNWCEEAGHKPKNRTGFIKAYNKILPENIQPFKTSSTRGFELSATPKVSNPVYWKPVNKQETF